MRPIIEVRGLSKRYTIGKRVVPPRTLRESLSEAVRLPFSLPRRRTISAEHTVWALKDVSFEVRPGEVVGVIGRNGAGKSTLLRILGRITEPTAGEVDLYGRVGSLLAVGTGFHLDLTGRENIYLSGAILGMSRREIAGKFDEIVSFGEVEKFIETAVKYYSSGMYVRLAFAIAAHLEPEILLVDEVLAVGDAAFQKKCLGKMHDVSVGGRTVLFVSHSMAAIESLCGRCLFLIGGRVAATGAPKEVITKYLVSDAKVGAGRKTLVPHAGRVSGSIPIMTEVALFSTSPDPTGFIPMCGPLSIQLEFRSETHRIRPAMGVVVKDAHGSPIFGFNNRFVNGDGWSATMSAGRVSCEFQSLPLMPGFYSVDLYFGDRQNPREELDIIQDAISFEVLPSDVLGTGKLPPATSGPVFLPAWFRVVQSDHGQCSNAPGDGLQKEV